MELAGADPMVMVHAAVVQRPALCVHVTAGYTKLDAQQNMGVSVSPVARTSPKVASAIGTDMVLVRIVLSLPLWSWVWIGWADGAIVLAQTSGNAARKNAAITKRSLPICVPP
jgi:hypothetical protein